MSGGGAVANNQSPLSPSLSKAARKALPTPRPKRNSAATRAFPSSGEIVSQPWQGSKSIDAVALAQGVDPLLHQPLVTLREHAAAVMTQVAFGGAQAGHFAQGHGAGVA
jgi:hypothetical protein